MKVLILTIIVLFLSSGNPIRGQELYEPFPLRAIKPTGWLEKQLEREFTEGYAAIFDKIQPSLQHQVFGSKKVRNFRFDDRNDWMVRNETWWWGEHEGYWADAVIRNAFLTGNDQLKQKADSIVKEVLKNQEEDGYIGIYEKGYRLNQLKGDNGELWTQSRMLNALLAYYEYTDKKEVLEAVVRAAKCTMSHYGKWNTYFKSDKFINGGGITHGLMFIETMEWLYRLTKDKAYPEFAQWLYDDYCASANIRDRDNQLCNLLDMDKLYEQHGVHVAEHARVVMWLSLFNKKNYSYQEALANQKFKFKLQSVPTGVLVSDEIVGNRYGTPELPYEYCVITESIISNFSLFAKSGSTKAIDNVEKLTFNAAMGARTPGLTEIAYCSRDNRQFAQKEGRNTRMMYSANHPNASCCNLNALKVFPYYVGNMWMKGKNSIVATCYGPSILHTSVNGTDITIEETTMYPFEDKVTLVVNPQKEVEFTLILRNPEWSDKTELTVEGGTPTLENGCYQIKKKWKKGEKVVVEFNSKVKQQRALNNEIYLQKGALLYALPVKSKKEISGTFQGKWHTISYLPQDEKIATTIFESYKLIPNAHKKAEIHKNPVADDDFPWDKPYYFLNTQFNTPCGILPESLVPIGSTILRKLTF